MRTAASGPRCGPHYAGADGDGSRQVHGSVPARIFRCTRDPLRPASLVRTGDTRTAFTPRTPSARRRTDVQRNCYRRRIKSRGRDRTRSGGAASRASPCTRASCAASRCASRPPAPMRASLPIVPVRARGLTIEGADGRRYLDCLSGRGHPGARPQPPGRARSHPEGPRLRRPAARARPRHPGQGRLHHRAVRHPAAASSPTTPASSSAARPARTPSRPRSSWSAPPPAATACSPSPAPTTA